MTVSTLPTLLLIDDEPALAAFVADAARISGYAPSIATDDIGFREAFVRHRPEVVAIDLGMPGMDGIELLRFLSDHAFDSPVLIISGFDRRVLESAFRFGQELGLKMVGPIEKPARLTEIEQLLLDLKPTLAR